MTSLPLASSRRPAWHLLASLWITLAAMLALSVQAQNTTSPAQPNPRVRLATTAGDIVVEVWADKAPRTADNFLQYVRDKHYDGMIFHRVIDNFMIQGGGYDTRFAERTTRAPVVHEGREALANGASGNVTGTLAMARTSNPHSATAQFFINVKDNAFLDHTAPTAQGFGYTVFGKVVSGMDVVNRIKTSPTGAGGPFPADVPRTPVIIISATLVR